MVVGVEEGYRTLMHNRRLTVCQKLTQRLLLEEKEAGVNQLEVLGEVVELFVVRRHCLYQLGFLLADLRSTG